MSFTCPKRTLRSQHLSLKWLFAIQGTVFDRKREITLIRMSFVDALFSEVMLFWFFLSTELYSILALLHFNKTQHFWAGIPYTKEDRVSLPLTMVQKREFWQVHLLKTFTKPINFSSQYACPWLNLVNLKLGENFTEEFAPLANCVATIVVGEHMFFRVQFPTSLDRVQKSQLYPWRLLQYWQQWLDGPTGLTP